MPLLRRYLALIENMAFSVLSHQCPCFLLAWYALGSTSWKLSAVRVVILYLLSFCFFFLISLSCRRYFSILEEPRIILLPVVLIGGSSASNLRSSVPRSIFYPFSRKMFPLLDFLFTLIFILISLHLFLSVYSRFCHRPDLTGGIVAHARTVQTRAEKELSYWLQCRFFDQAIFYGLKFREEAACRYCIPYSLFCIFFPQFTFIYFIFSILRPCSGPSFSYGFQGAFGRERPVSTVHLISGSD